MHTSIDAKKNGKEISLAGCLIVFAQSFEFTSAAVAISSLLMRPKQSLSYGFHLGLRVYLLLAFTFYFAVRADINENGI